MRLEQRIGRIDRLGQTQNIFIYNFAIRDTIEERILKILNSKIRLFENVIGSLDEILVNKQINHLDLEIQRIISETSYDKMMEERLKDMADSLTEPNTLYKG